MAIIKWSPFRELQDFENRLERMFGDARFRRMEEDGTFFGAWAPPVDIQETDKEYLIKADLPDLKKEDVRVEVRDGILTLEGERKHEKEEKGKTFHKIERAYGRFVRRFALPTEIDAEKVEAVFKEGVLNVHLPKTEVAKPKAIEVKVA